ncbi:MAG: dihydroneopterin aldolase [Selenomonadaceae bacterium]|nr:dihydroneopterin aldolase [Selenomonadaceae bacterium]
MTKVSIHNIMFYGFHGRYEYEREQGQKFYFDVELITYDDKSADSDNLDETLDTARVYEVMKEVNENTRFQVLSALCTTIADKVIEKFNNVDEILVRVRKPYVPIAGPMDYVEVEVSRKRK